MITTVRAAAVVALTATTLIALPSSAPTRASTGAGALVVSGGTLVDGTGREPLPGATIVVHDGRVAEVTAGRVATLRAGTEGIDARGKWIVPGLIDMPVHYQPGWMDALFLRHGVTTVRDVGEQVSLFGSPEEETMALLGEIPAARRQYWRAAAAGTPPDRTAAAARRLGGLKSFVARLQSAGGQVVAGSVDRCHPPDRGRHPRWARSVAAIESRRGERTSCK